MKKVRCPQCMYEKEYKISALPTGDLRYWKCPNCGEMGGVEVKPIILPNPLCQDPMKQIEEIIK